MFTTKRRKIMHMKVNPKKMNGMLKEVAMNLDTFV